MTKGSRTRVRSEAIYVLVYTGYYALRIGGNELWTG